jgi:archaellin
MATVTVKQGDTLEWTITVTSGGSAVDISSYSIRAHIRQNQTLVAALTVTLSDPSNGICTLSATAAQTDTWASGNHNCDIEFTDGSSEVFSTETFIVSVLEDISHD